MAATMGCTLVGGPRHGETVSVEIPDVGLLGFDLWEAHPTEAALVRWGQYRALLDVDAATGVLRWSGWGEWERPLP